MDWRAVYAAQDRVLDVLREVEHEFYLTGGTALSRGYYGHRYSEDLGFFVNDNSSFELWRDRCLSALGDACSKGESLEIALRGERYGRAFWRGEAPVKIEFVNDVPCRVGEPLDHPELGRLDTRENILANKVTALLSRAEPKDVADVFWLCVRDDLSLQAALTGASGKAAGVFPPLVAKALTQAADRGLPPVYWIQEPSEEEFAHALRSLARSLLFPES